MLVKQNVWTISEGWRDKGIGGFAESPQLAIVFGDRFALADRQLIREIAAMYPQASIIGCSTAGEISGTRVYDGALVVTAVQFECSTVQSARVRLEEGDRGYEAGRSLADGLEKRNLRHVFVLSGGIDVNGSDLVRGLTDGLPGDVTLTGGISGDGARFEKTLVVYADDTATRAVVAVGLYGSRLKIGFGSQGGWDPFGPERVVTKSCGNVLHELDGKSALDLYKRYLGEHAKGLPAAGLLFPLSLRGGEKESGVVRTILAVDEDSESMTFAGDIPVGSYARLMKANFDRLIDGAGRAAQISKLAISPSETELAILISCVGRKMVLK
jgi:hypothetical protein